MATLSQLIAWRDEAESALHALLTGQQAVEVQDQNLERVQYTRVNVAELRKYIGDLNNQIAALQGGSVAEAYGPLRPFF